MKSDGGPAFPAHIVLGSATGMSLRDWFAGQALPMLYAPIPEEHLTAVAARALAARAYAIADAMLRERERDWT